MAKSMYVGGSLLLLCIFGCADDGDSTSADEQLQEQSGAVSCALKDAAACGSDANCMPINAQAWNEELSCASATLEPVGCMDRDGSCPASIRYVTNDKGAKYQVTSGCLPGGFTDFSPASPGGRRCN